MTWQRSEYGALSIAQEDQIQCRNGYYLRQPAISPANMLSNYAGPRHSVKAGHGDEFPLRRARTVVAGCPWIVSELSAATLGRSVSADILKGLARHEKQAMKGF